MALPSWQDFRTQTDAQRESVEKEIVAIVDGVAPTGFTNTRVRFCARELRIWETSVYATCASTETTALQHRWPLSYSTVPLNFSWIAFGRFVAAYCSVNTSESRCEKLMKTENADAAFYLTRNPLLLAFQLFSAEAHAQEANPAPTSEAPLPFTPPALASMPSPALSSNVCKVEDGLIVTKTGKKIFLDFSAQPSEKHVEMLTHVVTSAADKTTTDVAIVDGLTMLNRLGKPLVANAKAKTPWVQEHLSKDSVKWIAVEQTEQDLGDRTGQRLAASFDAMKEQLIARKVPADAAVSAVTSGACPTAAVCVWLQNKNLRSTPIVPLKSQDLSASQLIRERQVRAVFDRLQELVKNSKLSKNEFDAIRRDYENLLLTTDPPDARTRAKARTRFGSGDAAASVSALYDLAVKVKSSEAQRNRALAKAALAQDGYGILSLPLSRRNAVIAALEEACGGPRAAALEEAPPEPRAGTSKKNGHSKRGRTSR